MNDKEYEEFKRLKEILLNHLSKVIPKPLILVIDNVNVKGRLEEVFKYDIQELSKYGENELFLMNNPKLKVLGLANHVSELVPKITKEKFQYEQIPQSKLNKNFILKNIE